MRRIVYEAKNGKKKSKTTRRKKTEIGDAESNEWCVERVMVFSVNDVARTSTNCRFDAVALELSVQWDNGSSLSYAASRRFDPNILKLQFHAIFFFCFLLFARLHTFFLLSSSNFISFRAFIFHVERNVDTFDIRRSLALFFPFSFFIRFFSFCLSHLWWFDCRCCVSIHCSFLI